jgi:hypothetical protein
LLRRPGMVRTKYLPPCTFLLLLPNAELLKRKVLVASAFLGFFPFLLTLVIRYPFCYVMHALLD